jgi:hypothetical protein
LLKDDNNLHPDAHHAYVAINYDLRLGFFGELLEHFFYCCFCPVVTDFNVIKLYNVIKTYDTWNDFTDHHGKTLHIGKLEFRTKHGKVPNSFAKHVHPRDVKSALCLLVHLFLEQPKVSDEDSDIHDSLMKQIKTSATNKRLHANSFGKVSEFISSMSPRSK